LGRAPPALVGRGRRPAAVMVRRAFVVRPTTGGRRPTDAVGGGAQRRPGMAGQFFGGFGDLERPRQASARLSGGAVNDSAGRPPRAGPCAGGRRPDGGPWYRRHPRPAAAWQAHQADRFGPIPSHDARGRSGEAPAPARQRREVSHGVDPRRGPGRPTPSPPTRPDGRDRGDTAPAWRRCQRARPGGRIIRFRQRHGPGPAAIVDAFELSGGTDAPSWQNGRMRRPRPVALTPPGTFSARNLLAARGRHRWAEERP